MAGFFSSLKAALYGEQEREAKAVIKAKSRPSTKLGKGRGYVKKFGILAKVEEVGVENLMSGSGYDSDSGDSYASGGYYMSGRYEKKTLVAFPPNICPSFCFHFRPKMNFVLLLCQSTG